MTRQLGRAAGLVAIGALQFYWYSQPAGFALKPLTAMFTLICIASPSAGLMAFAALAPVSSTIEVLAGGTGIGGGLMLEQLVLALGTGALVRSGQAGPGTRIGGPALLIAVVALASAGAMLPAAAAATAPPGIENDTSTYLRLLLHRRNAYFSAAWAPVFAAIMVAESCLLGWITERTMRRTPGLGTRLIAASLAGHAAAALLNVQEVVRMTEVGGGGLRALPEMLMTARLSMQTDVHAAGSALLLAGVAGFGLVGRSLTRNAIVVVLLAIVATGLWITGSRVAIGLGGLAAVIVLGTWAARSISRRIVVAGAGVIVIAGAVWLATLYPSIRYSTTSVSMQSRLLMAKGGVELFEGAPVFGIGISRFYPESAAVVGAEMAQLTGYQRENAHNNFIQVLAEQGIVGLAAMLGWLGVVVWAGWRAQTTKPDHTRACLLLAIVACIGTWMMGHPLLVREFSVVFWLYAGILLAMTPPASSRWNLTWPALAAVVILSVPVRAAAIRDGAELDHLGFGLSIWHHDDDRRYREAGPRFAIYLQSTGAPIAVPVRQPPGVVDPVVIEARIGGRVVQTVPLVDDAWHEVVIQVPRNERRFERVDFAVRPAGSPPSTRRITLRVGLEQAR